MNWILHFGKFSCNTIKHIKNEYVFMKWYFSGNNLSYFREVIDLLQMKVINYLMAKKVLNKLVCEPGKEPRQVKIIIQKYELCEMKFH